MKRLHEVNLFPFDLPLIGYKFTSACEKLLQINPKGSTKTDNKNKQECFLSIRSSY